MSFTLSYTGGGRRYSERDREQDSTQDTREFYKLYEMKIIQGVLLDNSETSFIFTMNKYILKVGNFQVS